MPLIVGIAFTSLKEGSDVFVGVLSSDDLSHTHSFLEQIIDPSDLTSTFTKTGGSIEALGLGSCAGALISLTVPTYLTEGELKAISITAKAVSPFSKAHLPTSTNVASLLESEEERQREYEGQYDLSPHPRDRA